MLVTHGISPAPLTAALNDDDDDDAALMMGSRCISYPITPGYSRRGGGVEVGGGGESK